MRKTAAFFVSAVLLAAVGACTGGGKGSVSDQSSLNDSLMFARGFAIDRHDGYTAVTVRDPWDTLRQRQCYILVERGKPRPKNLPDGTVISVPVKRAVAYSSVHASMLEQLGCLDMLGGVCEPEYITSDAILSRVQDGRIIDIGLSTSPDIEKIVELEAEVIIASPFENSSYGAAEKLGIPIIEASDYMENHPLGRTEWIRFFSLLFDREAVGDSIFDATASHYMELKALAASVETRPSVMLERKYGSAWPVPSGTSYIGTLHSDAGADYVFKDMASERNIPLPFETVFDKACNADFWLLKHGGSRPLSYRELEAEYAPYARFGPFRNGKVFACSTVGTSYYDDITLHPDRILEDLIALYHPELVPSHIFRYYFPLNQ